MQTFISKIGVGSDESKIIIVIVLDNNPLQWNSVCTGTLTATLMPKYEHTHTHTPK